MPHPIDHAELRQAAEHLLAIAEAGYGEQVLSEYHTRCREAEIVHNPEWFNMLAERKFRHEAEILSRLVDAPADQCLVALREAAGNLPAREIGLKVLADLAGDERRVQAQAHRQHFAGRRS